MARSSSTTRASISSSSRAHSSALNTSTASVNSRPTTPANRAQAPATTRSATPAKTRPVATTPAAQTSRPSTPTSRAHCSGPNSVLARPSSRPSTPTRRPPPTAQNSRPSSPTRSRTPTQPTVPPDFSLDAPPNLRSKLPERPISAGRQRPGMELSVRGNLNVEVLGSGASSSRRASSPAAARGRVADNQAKGKVNGHRDGLKMAGNQKTVAPEKKPLKPSPGGEAGGYGRTMSKNSLNMAIKHMDIRQGMSGMSGMRGASLFPHSIRSTAAAAAATLKDRPASRAGPLPPAHKQRITDHASYNNGGCSAGEELRSAELEFVSVKEISEMKGYGGSRIDARSLNWLQSLDEKPDETHLFDRRFDPLTEPFILM